MEETLTKKQEQFYRNLIEFINTNNYMPTIRELCDYVGVKSTSTVEFYLKTLEKKGYIKRINNRSIKILDKE